MVGWFIVKIPVNATIQDWIEIWVKKVKEYGDHTKLPLTAHASDFMSLSKIILPILALLTILTAFDISSSRWSIVGIQPYVK